MSTYAPDLDAYETGEWSEPETTPVECPECAGSGWVDLVGTGRLFECGLCDGDGAVDCTCPGRCWLHPRKPVARQRACEACFGTGHPLGMDAPWDECRACHGLGVVWR